MHLREVGGAATSGSSFLSAIRYARFIFGYRCLDSIINSRRVIGASDILYIGKRPLRQAVVLTVAQLRELHRFLDDECGDPCDKAFVAYIVTAIYARCRHSDLQRIKCILHDWDEKSGFVEMQTLTHKTGRTARLKTTLLPIVAPAIGIDGKPWPGLVERALEGIGLSFRGAIEGPLFRPPGGEFGLCRRGVSSSECSKFLQMFFNVERPVDKDEPCISSHSLKATCLSWASKYGMSPDDRAILGRHSDSVSGSSAIYSRDLVVGSCRKMQDMIMDIVRGRFLPDSSRRGYFADAEEVQENPCVVEVKEEAVVNQPVPVVEIASSEEDPSEGVASDGYGSETSSSLATSDESDCASQEKPRKMFKTSHVILPEAGKAFRHRVSKIVHFCERATLEDGWKLKTFSCGRRLGGMHLPEEERFDIWGMCRLCKQNALKVGALDV